MNTKEILVRHLYRLYDRLELKPAHKLEDLSQDTLISLLKSLETKLKKGKRK